MTAHALLDAASAALPPPAAPATLAHQLGLSPTDALEPDDLLRAARQLGSSLVRTLTANKATGNDVIYAGAEDDVVNAKQAVQSNAKTPLAPALAMPPDDVNRAILAVIHTGMLGHRDALAHRSALKDKARLFADFDHFSRLCVTDLRDAFNDDRAARSRMAKNRRRTWLAMSRYYARHAGIDQAIRIIALDRQGNYACQLVDKVARDDWQKFVQLGEQFGIDEAALLALFPDAQGNPADGAITPEAKPASPALVARRPLRLVA